MPIPPQQCGRRIKQETGLGWPGGPGKATVLPPFIYLCSLENILESQLVAVTLILFSSFRKVVLGHPHSLLGFL